jgi:hypothetical protein
MSEPETSAAELRQTLATLHAELGRNVAVDPESRRLLREVSADIERVISASEASGVPLEGESHRPRIESLAVRFEADHPALAGCLRQLIDILGRAGI